MSVSSRTLTSTITSWRTSSSIKFARYLLQLWVVSFFTWLFHEMMIGGTSRVQYRTWKTGSDRWCLSWLTSWCWWRRPRGLIQVQEWWQRVQAQDQETHVWVFPLLIRQERLGESRLGFAFGTVYGQDYSLKSWNEEEKWMKKKTNYTLKETLSPQVSVPSSAWVKMVVESWW